MNKTITLKAYKKEDWSGICGVFAQSSMEEVKGCCNPNAVKPLEEYKHMEVIRDKCNKVCAWHGDKVVGYVAYSLETAWVTSLYILPDYMGMGIGKALLEVALMNLGASITTNNYTKCNIESDVLIPFPKLAFSSDRPINITCMSNNIRAMRLYKSQGFKPVNIYMDLLNGYNCFYTNLVLRQESKELSKSKR